MFSEAKIAPSLIGDDSTQRRAVVTPKTSTRTVRLGNVDTQLTVMEKLEGACHESPVSRAAPSVDVGSQRTNPQSPTVVAVGSEPRLSLARATNVSVTSSTAGSGSATSGGDVSSCLPVATAL